MQPEADFEMETAGQHVGWTDDGEGPLPRQLEKVEWRTNWHFYREREPGNVCEDRRIGVNIEANEFRQRLEQVRNELENLQREAGREGKQNPKRPRKGEF